MIPVIKVELQSFVAEAEKYLKLVETPGSREELVRPLSIEMATLYVCALRLPSGVPVLPEPDTWQPGIEQWRSLHARLSASLGDWDPYYTLSSGKDGLEIVEGTLSDDLSDIAVDLQAGLSAAKESPNDGAWALRFTFETHWGAHLISALQALYPLLAFA